jgi:hypothetical protein
MNKQSYHKPEFRIYGNISVMTQGMQTTGTYDNKDVPTKGTKTA